MIRKMIRGAILTWMFVFMAAAFGVFAFFDWVFLDEPKCEF